jgi:hypothetical protein
METIILLILFIAIPLANYVIERMRRRYEPPAPDSRRVPDMGMRRQPAPPRSAVSVQREHAQEAAPMITVRPLRSRGSRQTLFRNKRDLRRTIVAMTILGPCRANDPPD